VRSPWTVGAVPGCNCPQSVWILAKDHEGLCLELAVNSDTVPSSRPPMFGHKLVRSCLGQSHFRLKVNIYGCQSMKKGVQLFLVMWANANCFAVYRLVLTPYPCSVS